MLIAAAYENDVELVGQAGVELVGDPLGELAGNASVEQLQQALVALAQAANWPAVNPGAVTGAVNTQTITAIAAVIGNLTGKINKTIQIAIQAGVVVASTNTNAMAAAKRLVGQYAGYLTSAVRALTAVYTVTRKPPKAPAPPKPGKGFATGTVSKLLKPGAAPVGKLPAGAITAFDSKVAAWRVAVPEGAAAQLGGPGVALGQGFIELPAQASQPSGARVVTVAELDKNVGKGGFFRVNNPLMWAAIAGGVVVLGGGLYIVMRR